LTNFYTFREIVIALLKRNQISTWAMRKSDFRMTHVEICCDLAMWKSDFCIAHVEIWFLFSSAMTISLNVWKFFNDRGLFHTEILIFGQQFLSRNFWPPTKLMLPYSTLVCAFIFYTYHIYVLYLDTIINLISSTHFFSLRASDLRNFCTSKGQVPWVRILTWKMLLGVWSNFSPTNDNCQRFLHYIYFKIKTIIYFRDLKKYLTKQHGTGPFVLV
jgi:hypothetical protein